MSQLAAVLLLPHVADEVVADAAVAFVVAAVVDDQDSSQSSAVATFAGLFAYSETVSSSSAAVGAAVADSKDEKEREQIALDEFAGHLEEEGIRQRIVVLFPTTAVASAAACEVALTFAQKTSAEIPDQ